MHVRIYHNLADVEPYRGAWDRLAGDCPFRGWTWLSGWWRHYGHDGDAALETERSRRRQLYVALAFADDAAGDDHATHNLVGVLPCYTAGSLAHGKTLRLIGDGQVCSDHLGLLVEPTCADDVTQVLAAQLIDRRDWQVADFAWIDDDDHATASLFAALADGRCDVARYGGESCWNIELPGDWESFLARQSKSHRKQLRQAERRVLESAKASWRLVETADEFDAAWKILADLHQRRRQSLGEPGCFAWPSWAAFHGDVARHLLAEGRLRLSTLELDGAPVAAEYHVAGRRTTFAYQGGVDPRWLAEEPGRLSTIRAIQHALAEGHGQFDFLRGDEPYKAHWRATPRPTWRWQAAAPRVWPKLRRGAWAGARRAVRLARQFAGLFG